MKAICCLTGGSHAYGLAVESSDLDRRGIYLLTEPQTILDPHAYLERQTTVTKMDGMQDDVYHEVRKFLHLVRQGNSNAVEMLFQEPEQVIASTPEWGLILANRERLFDSEKLYRSLKGYMSSELRLAMGERTGKLGGKRQEAVAKYGFSPKNFVQLLRICFAGTWFFNHGTYPINIKPYAKTWRLLMDIKTSPGKFNRDQLRDMVTEAEGLMDYAYTNNGVNQRQRYFYDNGVVSRLLLDLYYPILKQARGNSRLCWPFNKLAAIMSR